jgi:hypothetical protein
MKTCLGHPVDPAWPHPRRPHRYQTHPARIDRACGRVGIWRNGWYRYEGLGERLHIPVNGGQSWRQFTSRAAYRLWLWERENGYR